MIVDLMKNLTAAILKNKAYIAKKGNRQLHS